MIEEQFDQKVELALGNALSTYKAEYGNDLTLEAFNSCSASRECYYFGAEGIILPINERQELQKMISQSMSCFGIDENYDVALVNSYYTPKTDCTSFNSMPKCKSYSCSVNPSAKVEEDVQLTVSFPCREQYVFDNLKFMICSSILISLLLALVSFIILRALVQQKRITDNNIDFFNNAAHEFKTPLTNISLAANLFNRKNEQHKDQKYLGIIQRESAKLTNQIERVLHLSINGTP